MSDEAISKIEQIKRNSRGLRGTICSELASPSEQFNKENSQVLKFHGVYQQEDRDLRKERRNAGQGKAYQFMVRIKNPGGGRLSSDQWIILDEIADRFGNGSLRVTTRQGVQFHGVGKSNLQNTIRELNQRLISTFGACGDGNRNTMACPISGIRHGSVFDGQEWASQIAERLSFKTLSYYEIWLDGEQLPAVPDETEPIYGEAYLPRKFKIAMADPGDNCVDFLTNDIGILPALEGTRLEGFNIFVGGGMGSTHTKNETYPRLAEPLAFVPPEELIDLVVAVVLTQRDLGNREDRRQARLKYLIERLGIESFRQEVETRLGKRLRPPTQFTLRAGHSHLGWHRQKETGLNYFGLFVENGRILDRPGHLLKAGLRALADSFEPSFYLTPNQDLILADIPDDHLASFRLLMGKYGIGTQRTVSPLRSSSMACPALPTCGLAITEAERRLPGLISELEEAGFGNESIVMRMSGCPNSCSRPPVAEIGLIGKSVDRYNVYVGGNRAGTRLAKLLLEDVRSDDLAREVGLLIQLHRQIRISGEAFGDFCHRVGIQRLKTWLLERIAV